MSAPVVVRAPDKFKGALSAAAVTEHLGRVERVDLAGRSLYTESTFSAHLVVSTHRGGEA